MNAQQLKDSILQMAIQGKLIPQDSFDEPASVLLKRIRMEKEDLLKAGKIRKESNTSVIFRGSDNAFFEQIDKDEPICINDEIPFEIPKNWEWARLNEICVYIQRGKSPKYSPVKKYPVIAQKCNQWSGFSIEKAQFIDPNSLASYPEEKLLQDNDLMWNSTGLGTLGRMAIYKKELNPYELAVADSHVTVVRPLKKLVNPNYLYFYFASPTVQLVIEDLADGSTKQKELATATIKKYLVPLPPLSEQNRIVKKIYELLPYVEKYGQSEELLNKMHSNFPDQLKKSILQLAVQGKLVPQNPSDEPASVLLEHIREDKEQLIKAGKIKHDKHESVICRKGNSYYELVDGFDKCIDEEIPFDIPDSWEWVRLENISNYGGTKQKIRLKDVDSKIWALDLEDIEKGGRLLIRKSAGEQSSIGDKTVFYAGEILYSKLRPYLLKILVAHEDGVCSSEIVPFSLYGGILAEYIVNYLKSPSVDFFINSITYGTKMPRVGTKTMLNLLVPIPPIQEQHRIVEKVEELMAACNKI